MPEKKVKTENENVSSENKVKQPKKKVEKTKAPTEEIKAPEVNLELEELKRQNEILQQQMSALLAGIQMGQGSQNNTIANNKVYLVQSHMLNGVTISNINKDIVIFIPSEVVMEITYDDMFQIMKNSSSKSLFMAGCVEFVDDESYKDFNISNYQKIEYEDIEELFENGTRTEILEKLGVWTKNRTSNDLTHMVFNMIVSLSADFKLDLVSSKTGIVKDFFDYNLEDGVNNLRLFRQYMKK